MSDNEAQHSSNTSQTGNLLVEKLRHDLKTSGPWAQRFRDLVEAVDEARADCAECLSNLDIYISEELQGNDAPTLYVNMWKHLQGCDDCKRDHDQMLDVLKRERAGSEGYVPTPNLATPPLSFLQPAAKGIDWVSRVRSRLADAAGGVEFVFSLKYLADRLLLSPMQLQPTRGNNSVTSPAQQRLLLVDDITFENQQVNVEVKTTLDADRPDFLTLHATLSSNASLPENVWATLTWAGETYQAPVTLVSHDEGRAQIEDVSLSLLRDAHEAEQGQFEIALEVRQ